MPNSNFLQAAMARLLIKGVWFSDALTILHTVFPEDRLPDDWEDPFYNVTRNICKDSIVPIPNYKPIW